MAWSRPHHIAGLVDSHAAGTTGNSQSLRGLKYHLMSLGHIRPHGVVRFVVYLEKHGAPNYGKCL